MGGRTAVAICQSADSYLALIEKPEERYSENELAVQNKFEAGVRKVLTADGGQYPDALGDAEEERLGIAITRLAYLLGLPGEPLPQGGVPCQYHAG